MDEFEKLLALALESRVTDTTVYNEIKDAVTKGYAETTAKLKQNRDDILNEKKAQKEELDSAKKMIEGLGDKSIAELTAENKKYQSDIEELRANPGDATKLKQLEEAMQVKLTNTELGYTERIAIKDKEIEDAKTENSKLSKKLTDDLCLRALKDNLTKVGVKKDFLATVTDAQLKNVFVEKVGDADVVKYRNENGTPFPINEGVEYWAKSNKVFIGAPIMSGDGAGGS